MPNTKTNSLEAQRHDVHAGVSIVLAEDDADDRMFAARAFRQSDIPVDLECVEDGEELLDFLLQQNEHSDAERPDLILLDLNMPRKNGLEALREIKEHPKLKRIPVIVLTTSKADQEVMLSYELGCNAFIRKPVTYAELLSAVRTLGDFWFNLVQLPVN